jgi:hypothetical protein
MVRRTAYGLETPRDIDWRQFARCRTSPDKWHTGMGASGGGWARHQCLYHCPVLAECHQDAETLPARLRVSTVYGGLIYTVTGNLARAQRLDSHCEDCPPDHHTQEEPCPTRPRPRTPRALTASPTSPAVPMTTTSTLILVVAGSPRAEQ